MDRIPIKIRCFYFPYWYTMHFRIFAILYQSQALQKYRDENNMPTDDIDASEI